ncbi:hypothetical protein MSNKSG1_00753 [Marinobacter santoriniensis NKSG1]|uniref:Uncharacterized protein n=1 Tax=Marinobacter santoriniensis NKSG1 TaxID=1288826 RepID=M7DHG1_9GAMM|nr:hypothetical protein [Marinobacter santoriniensis]EMP57107.1 hypothetical protein MSNKSG1_00753 [Marinobacter santoriniensis NKSG1]
MARKYTEYERKIADASKAWRHYEWICSDEYAQREEDRHVVIAGKNYTGRPPVPLETQKRRAKDRYQDALAELRDYESKKHKKRMPEDEVKAFVDAQQKGKGRPAGGRAIALQKYIRRIERQIDDTIDAPESDFQQRSGLGRPPMSRAMKVKHYENLIAKAKSELLDLYSEMTEKERLWHELHDLKTDRRQLKMALRNPEHSQSKGVIRKYDDADQISTELDKVNAEITKKEVRMSMLEAGIDAKDDKKESEHDELQELEIYQERLRRMIKLKKEAQELEEQARQLGIDPDSLKS